MFLLKTHVLKLMIISTLFVLVTVDCSRTEEPEESEVDNYLNDDKIEGEGIVGGESADVTEFPYIAQIVIFGEQACGATIISEHWLLTAAHCFQANVSNEWVKIVVGTNYRNVRGNDYHVKQIILHENFDYFLTDNDIALIELDNDIHFNRKQKSIRIGKVRPKNGFSIKVAGFGRRGEGKGRARKLRSAVIPVVNFTKCSKKYKVVYPKKKEPITRNMFCAGKGEDETCKGDSGGPAVINGKLVGIISWGFDCGASQLPGVYTMVKNYREWISNHTGLTL